MPGAAAVVEWTCHTQRQEDCSQDVAETIPRSTNLAKPPFGHGDRILDRSRARRRSTVKVHCSLAAILLAGAGGAWSSEYAPELPPTTERGEPAIRSVVASASTVPQFGKLELTVDLTATYDNPFDSEQVDLTAKMTAPSGKHIVVPGFFYQPYRNRHAGEDSRRPLLEPAGAPCWKVRFTPTEVGKHEYVIRLRNRFDEVDDEVHSAPASFVAVASDAPGFLRVSRTNSRYFEFDNGQPFFAVGQNLQNDWPYYSHSRRLAAGGANCARVWTFLPLGPGWSGPLRPGSSGRLRVTGCARTPVPAATTSASPGLRTIVSSVGRATVCT